MSKFRKFPLNNLVFCVHDVTSLLNMHLSTERAMLDSFVRKARKSEAEEEIPNVIMEAIQ